MLKEENSRLFQLGIVVMMENLHDPKEALTWARRYVAGKEGNCAVQISAYDRVELFEGIQQLLRAECPQVFLLIHRFPEGETGARLIQDVQEYFAIKRFVKIGLITGEAAPQ